jgi:hypothetical protein
MENFNNDQKVLEEGRKDAFKGKIPEASLRDQIPKKLLNKLKSKDINVAEEVTFIWESGNANRTQWLENLRDLLFEFEEFVEPIYDAPYNWSSTLHLPIAYTLCRTFHSRMNSALLNFDPPFTVEARQEANSDRAPLVQELMGYAFKDWANKYQGVHEVLDRWIWSWVTSGRGILKYRWERSYSKFIDVVEVPKPTTSFAIDERGNEIIVPGMEMVEEEQEVIINTCNAPAVEYIQLEDLLIVGGEGDPDAADAVIHQQYLTASELWSLVDQGIFERDAVEATIRSGEQLKANDVTGMVKQDRSEINNNNLDVTHDLKRYRILEAYIKRDIDGSGIASDLIVWVAHESRSLLRATYLHRTSKSGKRPFCAIDFHRRTDTTNPVGLVELTYSLTKEMDAMHNMRIDFGLLSTMPFGFYRASSSLAQEKIPFEPGALIPLDNPQADVYFPNLGNRTSFGFQEEAALYQIIERMTSVSDLALGVLGAQGAARTATGARVVSAESNTNLDIYLKRMNRGFKKLLQGMFEMIQERIEPGFQFRLLGDDGNNYWRSIKSREEIRGIYDFELEGSSANSNKQVQMDTAQQLYQITANPLDIQLGLISPQERYEAVKHYLQSLGVKNFSKYIRKPDGTTRLFTPEEIANRILAGVDVRLGPEQDLQGFVNYVQTIIDTDELLGQFNEQQTILLASKMQEAQQMLSALKEMAAQQANAAQMQNNAAMSSQQTGGGGFVAPPVGAPQQ